MNGLCISSNYFPSCKNYTDSPAMRHQTNVSTFTSPVMLHPVSVTLHNSLRFFCPLSRFFHQCSLRFTCLKGGRIRVTTFRNLTMSTLGPSFLPRECCLCRETVSTPEPIPITFWSSLSSSLTCCALRQLRNVYIC